jgi:hypothetical protein
MSATEPASPAPTRDALAMLLRETFEGVETGGQSWYIDSDLDGCVLGLLATIPHDRATRAPGIGRRTIAQHAAHLRFHLNVIRDFVGGVRKRNDWDESWKIDASGDVQWKEFQRQLRADYQELQQLIASKPQLGLLETAASIGAVAHAAYHLGAIRQIVHAVGDAAAHR